MFEKYYTQRLHEVHDGKIINDVVMEEFETPSKHIVKGTRNDKPFFFVLRNTNAEVMQKDVLPDILKRLNNQKSSQKDDKKKNKSKTSKKDDKKKNKSKSKSKTAKNNKKRQQNKTK
jgi:hypothetical protein